MVEQRECSVRMAEEAMAVRLAYACAPVLLGMKAANSFMALSCEFEEICACLEGTRVEVLPLSHHHCKSLYLLYRRERLFSYLNQPAHREFLAESDERYLGAAEERLLRLLRRRMTEYADGNGGFPHELGLFLEYPLIDVKGYMQDFGKNSLYTGYWQVYGDVEEAKERFCRYHNAKDWSLQMTRLGYSLQELVRYQNRFAIEIA